MSGIDLAEAAVALARVQYERVWKFLDDLGPDASETSWDTSPSEDNKAQWLEQARQDAATVAPLIAAQVRAQIAEAIEQRRDGPWGTHGRAWEALNDAARIARGDA